MSEQLTQQERLALIYRMRVWYPRMKFIYDEIVRAFEMNPLTPDPECVALLGQFRTGKTTIVESFYSQHPRTVGAKTTHVPVLKAVVPAKASMNALLTDLLAALGDPVAGRGSMGMKSHRLHQFIRDCGVQMLILDEANHFVDRDSERVLHDVSNAMKSLVKEHNIACVLVGLPYTEEVLKVNEQFGSLFGDPYLLKPFVWDETVPETIEEFRTFLCQVETQLPLSAHSTLTSREMAWRCFVATHGKVGYVMRLIRRTAEMAVRHDQPGLSQQLLFEAFERTLAGKRRQITNPFGQELPQTPGPEEHEYWPLRQQTGA
ncbi:MAG: TniB family NTP-binding protein [Anaerolineae bacterium]|nr:TniB family NTP-binding protein [Anaerolineae bacterium]